MYFSKILSVSKGNLLLSSHFCNFFIEILRKFCQLVRQKQNGAYSVERDWALVQNPQGVPSARQTSSEFYIVVFTGFNRSKFKK